MELRSPSLCGKHFTVISPLANFIVIKKVFLLKHMGLYTERGKFFTIYKLFAVITKENHIIFNRFRTIHLRNSFENQMNTHSWYSQQTRNRWELPRLDKEYPWGAYRYYHNECEILSIFLQNISKITIATVFEHLISSQSSERPSKYEAGKRGFWRKNVELLLYR